MYEASFGLNAPPFRLMPDPHFYLEGGQYGTILAKLLDGLETAEPWLLLTGPAGTGKTAAAQRLLILLDRSRWTVGTMFAAAGGLAEDALLAAAQAFCLAHADTQPGHTLDAWLSTQAARGGRVLLVVDEAQHLEGGALRQLADRLVPAGDTPRLQLCLVGEHAPAALAGAERDGSLPPVVVHCRLRALDATETRDYVLHRLRCAGWTGRPAFDSAATDAIHRLSEGIPRRVHLLADRVLLQMSTDGVDVATAAAVEAADEQRTVELQGLAPIEGEVRAPAPVDAPVSRTPSIEMLLAGIVVPSRARPRTGTRRNRDAEAPPNIEPHLPPLPLARDHLSASSPAAAPAGGSPRSPEGAVPPGARSAGTASAGARGLRVGPAAGAIVVAVAGIGIGWWLGDRGWPAAPGSAPRPAPAPVTAAPVPVAGLTPSASPNSAAPPRAAETARAGPGEALPALPRRSGSEPAISASLGRGALPTGALPLDARRAAAAAAAVAPADERPAGKPPPPRSAARAAPASPTPATCTGTAAVLGLCEPAAGVTPPATRSPMPPPPERTAPPAADAVRPEPLRATPLAAPLAAPCEPNRAALGLCER